jgi:hypothetical protein
LFLPLHILRIDFFIQENSLNMFVINGINTIGHANADCHCSSCKQLHKPDKIVALPSFKFRHRANLAHGAAYAKTGGIDAIRSRDNVISFSAAIKSAGELRAEKVRRAKFNYPMLECS